MDYSSHPQRFDIEAAGASAVPDDTLSYALTAAVDICVWQYDASGSLCATTSSNIFWNTLFEHIGCLRRGLEHCGRSQLPIILENDIDLFWIAFYACPPSEASSDETSNGPSMIVLGPVFITDTPNGKFTRDLYRNDVPDDLRRQTIEAKATVPNISITRFEEYAALAYSATNHRRVKLGDFIMSSEQENRTTPPPQMSSHQGSWEYEQVLMKTIENGDIDHQAKLKSVSELTPLPGKLSRGGDALRQSKNAMIVYVAICCRAAIRGGCPVETAYSMSDSYIQDIESAHTVNEVNTIAVSMFNDYVLTVWHVKQITQYSPLINRCVMLIRMHSFERYKLSDLAREVGYSPYYLSTRFKEETGRTIGEALRESKIEYAKFLLTDTTRSVACIADSLGFANSSYFISVFRRHTGRTPKQWRESHRMTSSSVKTDDYDESMP